MAYLATSHHHWQEEKVLISHHVGYETGLDDKRHRHTRKELKVITNYCKFDMLHKSCILNKKGKDKRDKANEHSQVLENVTEKEGS